jgi:hypothetical protein
LQPRGEFVTAMPEDDCDINESAATEVITKESRVSGRARILLDKGNITDISTSRLQMVILSLCTELNEDWLPT